MASKISQKDAQEIRVRLDNGEESHKIATQYGVHTSVIDNLAKRNTFRQTANTTTGL